MLQNVGKMPVNVETATDDRKHDSVTTNIRGDDYCRGVQWPMCLNAGDIAKDGKILIRNYECK